MTPSDLACRELVRVSGRISIGSIAPDPPAELLRAFKSWKRERA